MGPAPARPHPAGRRRPRRLRRAGAGRRPARRRHLAVPGLPAAGRDGSIACRPGIATIDGHDITFTDGSTETVEAIVCATGYDVDIPYLDALGPELDLYHRTFHPDLPGLGVMG